MFKKCYAFAAQPNAHFRVKLLEAHYESFGDKTKEDTHSTSNGLREKLKAFDKSYVPLDVSHRTDYDLGHDLNENILKVTVGKRSTSIRSMIRNATIYHGEKHYEDFVETVETDGVKKKRRTKVTRPIRFEYKNCVFSLEQKQSLADAIVFDALQSHPELVEKLKDGGYNVFSDRSYSPEKSDFCVANSLALYVALSEEGSLDDYLSDFELLKKARDYH